MEGTTMETNTRKFDARYVVSKVKEELSGYEKVRASLVASQGDLDEQTLLDTLEGETELHEAVCAVAEVIQENNAQVAGIEAFIDDLTSRKNRINKTSETLRNIITMAMDRAGIKTIQGPLFTLSTRHIKPGLIVNDEAAIPSDYFVPQDPKLDRRSLLSDLEGGKFVEGASLSNGGIGLTIRVK